MLSPYQLGKTLEKLRTNKHMSQVEVSEHINISPKHYQSGNMVIVIQILNH